MCIIIYKTYVFTANHSGQFCTFHKGHYEEIKLLIWQAVQLAAGTHTFIRNNSEDGTGHEPVVQNCFGDGPSTIIRVQHRLEQLPASAITKIEKLDSF